MTPTLLSKKLKILGPCPEAIARKLLAKKLAVVTRQHPYTIKLLKDPAAITELRGLHLEVDT